MGLPGPPARRGGVPPLWRCFAAAAALVGSGAAAAASSGGTTPPPPPWYAGLPSVKVLTPGEPGAQAAVDALSETQRDVEPELFTGQFNDRRYAILLTKGHHDLNITVGYYMSVAGVAPNPDAVTVSSVRSLDGPTGGATQNFFRSVEGVTVQEACATWATSQACPLRRSIFEGDLWLSDKSYSSGGFAANVHVKGQLHMGTQQQFLWRNSKLEKPVDYTGGWNYVFVGVDGAPEGVNCNLPLNQQRYQISSVPSAPKVAEKPFLVEEQGVWSIAVPSYTDAPSSGVLLTPVERRLDLASEVFVARADRHKVSEINRKMANASGLLLTPGIYLADEPLLVSKSDFVVLGIGFPTLVAVKGQSALRVADGLSGVRLAGLLLEAGTPSYYANGLATEPLLQWGTPGSKAVSNGSAMSDIFARVGAFRYHTAFKPSCLVTRADTMVEVNAGGVVLDNLWLWVSDHDDCGPPHGPWPSDSCVCKHGLVVNGDDVVGYGLMPEHTSNDLLQWNGERGQVFMFQSELPYHQATFGQGGEVGYRVRSGVTWHKAVGVGVYLIGNLLRMETAVKVPASVNMTQIVTATLGGSTDQFRSSLCLEGGACLPPDLCGGPICWTRGWPASLQVSNGTDNPHTSAAAAAAAPIWRAAALVWLASVLALPSRLAARGG